MGGMGLLTADSGELNIVEMLDQDGRQIWQPAAQSSLRDSGVGGMILNFPYWVSSEMPAVAASATPALFGDYNAYTLATAQPGMFVKRVTGDTDKSLENNVAFLVQVRCGGLATGAPTGTDNSNAYKFLTMKS